MSSQGACCILSAVSATRGVLSVPLEPEMAAVARFQAGDETAFQELVFCREADVYRQTLRMLGNAEDDCDKVTIKVTRDYNLDIDKVRGRIALSMRLSAPPKKAGGGESKSFNPVFKR